MSDPAVAAAQRDWANSHPDSPGAGRVCIYMQITAAREALKPIREWFDRSCGFSSMTDNLLDELAPLIFPTEELEQ